MVRPDAGGGGGPYIEVDVDSVRQAAGVIDSLAGNLDDAVLTARNPALAAFGAIAPSDLQRSYGFCWGRWSQCMLEAATALVETGNATHRAARTYQRTESAIVRAAQQASQQVANL